MQVQIQAARMHTKHSRKSVAGTRNPMVANNFDEVAMRPVHYQHNTQDDFADDLEEGGWSSGFDDSDDDMMGGPF